MAGSVNKVIIVGRCLADPDTRTLGNGDTICKMTLVTSEQWRDKGTGEKKEKAEFHNVVIYNDALAKIAGEYVRKGSQVYVEGAIQSRKYQNSIGVEKRITEIVLQKFNGNLTLLSGGSERSGASEPELSASDQFKRDVHKAFDMDLSDEIPFSSSRGLF